MKRKARRRTSKPARNGEDFYVTAFSNPSGSTSYRVSGMIDGKQLRKNFGTEAEAIAEKQDLEKKAYGIASETKPRVTRLTDAQLQQAEAAFAALDGRSMPLAIDFFIKSYQEPVKAKLLTEAKAEFIADKLKKGKRPDTIRNLNNRVDLLANGHPDKHVHEILKADVEAVVFSKGIGARTQVNNRLALSAFFGWCQKQRYCQSNPAREVEPPEVDAGEPVVLSLVEVRKLLSAARVVKDGKLVPYVALAVFCGIRPTELARISWKDISLDDKTVTIQGKHAKMRSRRIVDISDNAVAWLTPFAVSRPPIRPQNFRKDFDRVKELAGFDQPPKGEKPKPGVKPWVQDSMRHSAISAHLRFHGDEGRTASWAGNSMDVCHRSYKGLMSADDAREFWDITPDDQKILNLRMVV